jgi:hypothetical protein
MYDLNREVAEKLKVSSVFSTTSSHRGSHDGEHACCRETMRQTDPPSDAGQRHFSDVLSLADQLGCKETSSTMSRWLCVRLCVANDAGDRAYRDFDERA